MQDRIFGDREKANEAVYFRSTDARLIEKLRQKACLDEIAIALGDKLQVDNPDLLLKVRNFGITLDTAPALLLAPMVQVAWAEGKVSTMEREVLFQIAQRRGVEPASPAHAQLDSWLQSRPPNELFDLAIQVLKFGYGVLPPAEKAERIKDMVDACRKVAAASGGLERLLGIGDGVSPVETLTLDDIARALRGQE
jgi:hypothetical protein